MMQDWNSGVLSVTLAQGGSEVLGAPSGGGAPAGGGGSTGQPGGGAPAGGPPPGAGGMGLLLPLMLGLLVFMMVTSMMSGRKEKKKRAEMMSSLKKRDRVQTVGGIIGTIVELKGDEIVLKVDEGSNTRIRFARTAVQSVVKYGRGEGESAEPEESEASESLEPAGR